MSDQLMQTIHAAYANGQLERAFDLCQSALARQPDNAAAHNMAAVITAQGNSLDEARRHAERAIRLAPDNASFVLNAALIHEQAGRLADAEAANRRVLELAPDHAGALANLANLARLRHDYDDALALYARAHAAAPGNSTVLTNWAVLLGMTGRHDEAIATMQQALELAPDAPDLLAVLAEINGSAGRHREAIAHFENALARLGPEAKPTVLANLAVTQLKAGVADAARTTADELDRLDPGNRTAAAVRYIAALKIGDRMVAEQEMDVARYLLHLHDACPPDYPDAHTFARALGVEVLQHPSLEYEPTSKTTRGGAQSGNLVPGAGPGVSALRELITAQVHDYLDAHSGATITAAQRMRHFELNIWATVLDRGGRQLPHIHPAGVLSGVFYVAVPDPQAGAIEFGMPPEEFAPFGDPPTHTLAPRCGDFLMFPSQFYHRTLAFEHTQRRISIAFDVIPCALDAGMPRAAVAALAQAGQALQARDFGKATAIVSQLTEQVPDYAEAWFLGGQLALQTGDHASAIERFERATGLRPRVPQWWYQLGVAHQRAMHYPAAKQALERSLGIDQHFEPARMALASLHTDLGHADDALRSYRQITARRAAAGRAWYGIALQRAASLSGDDVATMRAAVASPDLPQVDAIGLHFALGRALEQRADYDDAFAHFAAGNRIKRSAQPFDAAAEQRNADAICAAFTPELFARFEGSGIADDTPALIVGMPRSGSTLVEQIIASHPDVRAAGETNALWRTLGGLGRFLPAGKRLPGDIADVPAEAWRELGRQYVATLRQEAGGDASRITDKLPFNYTLLGMLRLMLPNAFIIDARRHPMDTCWSCFATSFGVDRGFTNDLADLGATYRSYNRLMAHWNEVLPRPLHTQHYEALIGDTPGQVRALLAYLDLPWHDDCLEFHRTERAVTTSSYAQVRQPIYTSSVERWRRFERHLQPLREALGPALAPYEETNS